MKAAAVIGEEIARLAAELTVGEHRLVRKIGEFDASGEWARQGALSCAKWLSWRIGLAPGAAREKVRVARALPALPHLDRAFERGELSYSKVRAVTRVATPESDEDLVQIAKHTTASQLERVCRRFHRVLAHDARITPEDAEARRVVEPRWTDDGQLSVKIMLPADEGARLLAALESAHAAAKEDSASATRADGLRALVESWFESGARPRPGGAPHEVVVHVLAETLAEERAPRVPAETRAAESAVHAEQSAHARVPAETRDAESAVHAEQSAHARVPAETRAAESAVHAENSACSHVPA